MVAGSADHVELDLERVMSRKASERQNGAGRERNAEAERSRRFPGTPAQSFHCGSGCLLGGNG